MGNGRTGSQRYVAPWRKPYVTLRALGRSSRASSSSAQSTASPRARGVQLWRPLDRAAVHEQVPAEHTLRVVAHQDLDACLLELGGGVGLLEVAAAHLVAAGEEDARQGGDSRPSCAHQMDSHLFKTSCSTARTRCAASRRPAAAEALAIARRRPASRPSTVLSSVSPVSWSSAMRDAAPASTMAAAFSS